MGFGWNRSTASLETVADEGEIPRRNRLSKPLTNKSNPNLAALASQEAGLRSKNNSTTEIVTTPLLSPKPSLAETRQQIRSHVFDSDVNESPPQPLKSRASWNGVALMIRRIESNQTLSNSSQPSLLSPTKTRRPVLSMLGALRPSTSHENKSNSSKERLATPNEAEERASISPSSSLEQIDDETVMPTARRASFAPGTATRKASGVQDVKRSGFEDDAVEENDDADDQTEIWVPPAQDPRPLTPSDLDYTHLGGLSLGTLQVVNGRASPACSDMSKMSRTLIAFAKTMNRRDASSEYGDSEAGDHPSRMSMYTDSIQIPQTPKRTSLCRESSRYSKIDNDTDSHYGQNLNLSDLHYEPVQAQDWTSVMAAEYMAELPDSPFAVVELSPAARTLRAAGSIESFRRSFSQSSIQKSPVLSFNPERPSQLIERTPSPTGTVLKIDTKRNEIDDDLFEDETLGSLTDPDRATLDSWHSPVESISIHEEAFQSAVELQLQQSPQRSDPPGKRSEKSDSGYSSNNSTRSLSGGCSPALSHSESLVDREIIEPEEPQLAVVTKVPRPSILKKRQTAPAVPTFSNLRPTLATSVSSNSNAISNPESGDKLSKNRKKLQKRRLSQMTSKDITVQGHQILDPSFIPPIPRDIEANLRIRSQEVPELEQTFRSMNHVKNQASVSTMNLNITDIRFPSPGPEALLSPKSKSPDTRRWSFLSRKKDDKPSPRLTGSITRDDAMAMINDFGTVAQSLGKSPYDMAHRPTQSHNPMRYRVSPYDISTQAPHPRHMMDDVTAAEFARARSRSIQERDIWNERVASFNDRGGIPGKNLRPESMRIEMPPLPPLPTSNVVHDLYETDVETRFSSESEHIAPPPPPHSPRPSIISPHDDIDELALPPPPPSHSPQPMGISSDPWATQAAMWKARRQSAGDTLKRSSWHTSDERTIQPDFDDEPLYPEIPFRNPFQPQGYQHGPQNHFDERSFSQRDYNDYDRANAQSRAYDRKTGYDPREQYWQENTASQHHRDERRSFNSSQHRNLRRPMPLRRSGDDYTSPPARRPLPTPSPRSYDPLPPRPRSQAGSFRSVASSMAEELHPADLERQHPAPEFGRYSGGMTYGYEGRNNGFGGSAGTRSVSGKADGMRKGVPLRASFGVDLGDVPIMGVTKKL